MCGRFRLTTPGEEIAAALDLPEARSIDPRYNIAPSQPVEIVRVAASGRRTMIPVLWGLIPAWSAGPGSMAGMINARAETLFSKPSFRSAARRRRCLIPADGFYEWARDKSGRQPYLFQMTGGSLFAFAGIWETWLGPNGEEIDSCAIVTTSANELVRPIHDRMPVILVPGDYALWLDPSVGERETTRIAALLGPPNAGLMTSIAVSRQINSPHNEGPDAARPANGQ